MRTIKRYSNRKLYDTTERHYVTLADVAGFVRKGDDVQVTDYVTSADLTAQTLAQIIFEEEKKSPRVGDGHPSQDHPGRPDSGMT
jgi:polyhydroxyalkanoate synthesis repressor PhaR